MSHNVHLKLRMAVKREYIFYVSNGLAVCVVPQLIHHRKTTYLY